MRLSPVQLAQIQSYVDRVNRVRRSDDLIAGEYKFRLEELAEAVLTVVTPDESETQLMLSRDSYELP